MDGLAILFAVAATVSWALTVLLMKVGVDRMDWVGFGFLRPWMALPFLLVYALLTDGFASVSAELTALALASGVVNALFGTALYYAALARVPMHEVNILAYTNPFWGVVSAILVLGEPALLPRSARACLCSGEPTSWSAGEIATARLAACGACWPRSVQECCGGFRAP